MRERTSLAGRRFGVGTEAVDDALRMRFARAREWRRFSGFGVSEEVSDESKSISGVSWVLVKRSCISTRSPNWRGGGRVMLDIVLKPSSESTGWTGAMDDKIAN